jgi:hypothetical protein
MSGKDCLISILLATQEWMTNEGIPACKDRAPRFSTPV